MPTRAGPRAGGPLHPHNCPMLLQVTQAGEGRTGQALGSPPHPSASGCLRPAPPMQEGSRTHTPPTAPWTSAVRPETVIYTGPFRDPELSSGLRALGSLADVGEHLLPHSPRTALPQTLGMGCSPGTRGPR